MTSNKVYLHKIVTTVPEKYYTQEFALNFLLKLTDSEKEKELLTKLYKGTEIYKRHTVIDDYDKDPSEYTFYPPYTDPYNSIGDQYHHQYERRQFPIFHFL